jgi:hypothetical protein
MPAILSLLAKYIGLPLIEKLGKWLFSMFKDWQQERKVIKDQKKKTEAIANGETKDETKSAHRNNKL